MQTDKQTDFIQRLATEKNLSSLNPRAMAAVDTVDNGGEIDFEYAKYLIGVMIQLPRLTINVEPRAEISEGMYQTTDGTVYAVRLMGWIKSAIKRGENLRMMYNVFKMVEIRGARLNETEYVIHLDQEYVQDGYKLFGKVITTADKMPLDAAQTYSIRFGFCGVCGRKLKDAQSVKNGIGPVCAKIQSA